jgi:hypothetical protein
MNKRMLESLRLDGFIRPSSGASMGAKVLIFVGLFACQLPLAHAVAKDYYFDSLVAGPGTGTSTDPFKLLSNTDTITVGAGDRILLRRGRTFPGRILIKEGPGGTAAAPVLIQPYGGAETDPAPIIASAGLASAGIVIRNKSHITIQGLEITNWASTPDKRDGIRIETTAGTDQRFTGIKILNNYIHHVHGYTTRNRGEGAPALYDTAAIHIICYRTTSAPSTAPIDNILIEGNDLFNNNCIGILSAEKFDMAVPSKWPTNLIVRGNFFNHGGADHIVIKGMNSPIIESNIGYNAGAWGSKGYEAIAGMWVGYQTRNSLFRLNEVAYTYNEYSNAANGDSKAFDVDYGTTDNHIFEYNYTHDNAGGVLIIMSADTSGINFEKTTVYRYNLSVNDSRNTAYSSQFGLHPFPGKSAAYIHNNVFYTTKPEGFRFSDNQVCFYTNNVFHSPSAIYSSEPRFSHNAYYNHEALVNDPYKVTANPKFAGNLNDAGDPGYSLVNTQMFKVLADSPLINAGKTISIPGVTNLTKDFWGINNLNYGRPDIGIHEHPSPVVGTTPAPTTAATTVYENNAGTPTITQSSGWVHSTGEIEASGNSLARLSGIATSQWIQVNFTGNNITLYGKRGPKLGMLDVSVNGDDAVVVDCYFPQEQFRVPLYTATNLPTTQPNTLRATVKGQKHSASGGTGVGIDYFEKLPVAPPQQPKVTIIDDQAGTVTGSWDRASMDGYYGNTRSISSAANSTISFNFTGTGVRLYGSKASDRGKMTITVADRTATVDQFSPVSMPGYLDDFIKQFEVTDLPMGTHTLKVTVTSPRILVDYIEVLVAPTPPAGPVKVDTNNTLNTTGTWNHTTDAAYDQGTKSVSNSKDASMSMTFTGTKARLYVRKGPNLGKLNMSVNGGTPTLVDCNATTNTYAYMIYETPTLPQGQYTLTATVYDPGLTGKYVGLDYFEYLP